MAPLEGHTLGQRQKYYNQLVKEAIANQQSEELPKINFEEDDVDNMLKIDIACITRDVDYILDVFTCADMLYVSRAIKKSRWLITDDQYAHIIDPEYLHSVLFPQMYAKAITRLMLHIRRYLKDEARVQKFYEYVHEKNPQAALRWLGNCSLTFIETVVTELVSDRHQIPMKLLKRLCRKSLSIFQAYARCQELCPVLSEVHKQTHFYLKSDETAEIYLDICRNSNCPGETNYPHVDFNKKYTHILMKKLPSIIKDDFRMLCNRIDLTTFVKYMSIDEIKFFLLIKINSFDNAYWKNFDTLSPFLAKLNRDETLEFLSALYEVDFYNSPDSQLSLNQEKSRLENLFYAIDNAEYEMFSNIYRWYRFAPFDLAFSDMKKFIFAESCAKERQAMLIVLLNCASYDFEHVKTVLQYYHDNHMNESYLHKISFVNSVLTQYKTFRFDDSTWNILNAIFHSLEVYIESDNEVQACLVSIIVHNVLRDLPVHEVVEKKFEIKTLVEFRDKLNSQEQEKLFNYLYDFGVSKISKENAQNEVGMHKAIKLLKTIWNLLNDWDRVETHKQFIINKTVELCDTYSVEIRKGHPEHKQKPCKNCKSKTTEDSKQHVDISSIYRMAKSHRKELLKHSLVLHPSEEALLNALKHDPGLLTRCKSEIDDIRCNANINLKKFLSKLRIYWLDSLATEWTEVNMTYLKKCTRHHRSLVRGILTLLPLTNLLEFIKTHASTENKTHWSDTNVMEVSTQKHIAENMHIVRPQLPAEVLLWYAKSDYIMRYVLFSLNIMYYNFRSSDIENNIYITLEALDSVQQRCIRLAFVGSDELVNVAPNLWKTTKNSYIRAILFKSVFDLLCKQEKRMGIRVIWLVLSSFIDDLTYEENKIIYDTLGKVKDVPLLVIGKYYEKAYLYLKSLPHLADSKNNLNVILCYAPKIMKYLNSEFVEKSLLTSVSDMIENCDGTYLNILSAYMLCSKTKKIQMQKYCKLMHPVIEECVPKWADGQNDLIDGIQAFLKLICSDFPRYVFEMKMILPLEMLSKIRNALCKDSLSIKEHYITIRRWQLFISYFEIIDAMTKKYDERHTWEYVRQKTTRKLAEICYKYLSEDNDRLYTSVYVLFKEVLNSLFEMFGFKQIDQLNVLYRMLQWESCPVVYLLVLDMIPDEGSFNLEYWNEGFSTIKKKIKRKIFFYPSEEVKMHYFRRFSDKYNSNDDVSDSNEDSDTEDPQETSDSEFEEEPNQNDGFENRNEERKKKIIKLIFRSLIL